MSAVISIEGLSKTYSSGFVALKSLSLEVKRGEILALLGPNGAGKTTLIGCVCGLVRPTEGSITVNGFDSQSHYRQARAEIGLVPQELATDAFETVRNTVQFSRGVFGKPKNPSLIEKILRDLSLWDKRDNKIMALSGGMKRRVLIAKALSHEPSILFLDEPTAGVDVELRRDMWRLVHKLREAGTTVVLTTHYIEEAEEMADRVGVMRDGQLLLLEDKEELMKKLGTKEIGLLLVEPLQAIPAALNEFGLKLEDGGAQLRYSYNAAAEETGVSALLKSLRAQGIAFRDLQTHESSLEEIFVSLVSDSSAKETQS